MDHTSRHSSAGIQWISRGYRINTLLLLSLSIKPSSRCPALERPSIRRPTVLPGMAAMTSASVCGVCICVRFVSGCVYVSECCCQKREKLMTQSPVEALDVLEAVLIAVVLQRSHTHTHIHATRTHTNTHIQFP